MLLLKQISDGELNTCKKVGPIHQTCGLSIERVNLP
jgi:hypothetical protein